MNIKVKNNKYYGIQKKEGEYYIIPSKENPNKHDWVIAKIESEKDGFTLTENYKVVFTLEFEEPKPSCANYERDNILLSEIEQNVADYIAKKDWKEESIEEQILGSISVSPNSDPIVESVRQKLLDRSDVGLKKYNTSIWDNTDENYIKHLQDELLDGANYCEQMLRLGEFTTNVSKILDKETNYYTIGELIVQEYNKLKNDRTDK